MLACTRRCVDDCRCNLHRVRQRDDHSMHTDNLRRAKESSEVLWVIERIKHQDKRRFILLTGMVKDFNCIAVYVPADLSHYSLMVLMEIIEPRPLHFFNGNPAVFCHL